MPCDVTTLLVDVTAEGGVYIAEISNCGHRTTISVFRAATTLSGMKTLVSHEELLCVLRYLVVPALSAVAQFILYFL